MQTKIEEQHIVVYSFNKITHLFTLIQKLTNFEQSAILLPFSINALVHFTININYMYTVVYLLYPIS